MDAEGKFWAWVIGCFTIVVIAITICITYYTTDGNRLALKLVQEGVNPAIARCLHVNWEFTGTHDICKAVLTDGDWSIEEIDKLMEQNN